MDQPGGLTFAFSDIEGSTRLVQDVRTGYGLALRIHRRILETAFEAYGGRPMGDEGDAKFFVLSDTESAVRGAIDAQRRIEESDWPDGLALRLRMGIHRGPVRVSAGEYVGLTIHEVARICAAANGGQILCSAPVATAVRDCPDIKVHDLGRYVLRGIAGARSLFQIRAPGLADDALAPRDAARDGGRRVTIWRRDEAGAIAPLPGNDGELSIRAVDGGPLPPDVDVEVHRLTSDGDPCIRLVVWRGDDIDEEYDGLTIGGAADAAAVVNAHSLIIRIAPDS